MHADQLIDRGKKLLGREGEREGGREEELFSFPAFVLARLADITDFVIIASIGTECSETC